MKFNKLRLAIDAHNKLMGNARDGKGIDRHLFGLWCAAYEEDIDIPELYDDPLYKKRYRGIRFLIYENLFCLRSTYGTNAFFFVLVVVEVISFYQPVRWDIP